MLAGHCGRTEGLGAVGFQAPIKPQPPSRQLTLFTPAGDELRKELAALDPETLTPFDALLKLRELVEKARGQKG